MRCCFCLIYLLFFCFANGQRQTYKNELIFRTDNDAYLFEKKDGYYTNGMFLKLNVATEKLDHKIINSYELGQMIFTPENVNFYRDGSGIDRPFCGYLYASYNRAIFLPQEQVVQWAISIGTVGPNALGQNVQELIHKWFQFKSFRGWDTQISNEVGVNATAKYATVLSPIKTDLIAVIPELEVTVGNLFINAKMGGYFCVGLMESASYNSLFNAGIGKSTIYKKHNAELFFYWHPQFIYQVYNATVQGGLFFKDMSDITAPIWSTIYTQSFGVLLAAKRVSTKLEIVYLTQEAKTQKSPQRYASIGIGYRFN